MLKSSLLALLFSLACVTATYAQVRNDDVAEITTVIQQYYDAVTNGDSAPLEALFHEGWHMKNLDEEGATLLVEDKSTFLQRIQGRPLPSYGEDRHITSIDVAYERLATVRVDKPSSRTTTIFALFKLDDGWVIANKLWANSTTAPSH